MFLLHLGNIQKESMATKNDLLLSTNMLGEAVGFNLSSSFF